MEALHYSNRRTARVAAALFFFVCVPLSLWETNVQSRIFVPQDPTATASNLLSNEFLFRTSIVSHLTGIVAFAFMILLFYRLFKPVDKHLSRLMLFSVLAMIPIVFVFEVLNLTALVVLKGEPRSTFNVAQQQEVVYFLMRMPRTATGAGMGKLFLGLCFIPFGMLVYRSGFVPRVIGILFIIGGVGYVVDCILAILLQRADYVYVRSYLMYTTLAYAAGLLWFLVRGLNSQIPVIDQSQSIKS
jgi:hypothetical protein